MILVRFEASIAVLQNYSMIGTRYWAGSASAPISKLTTANYYAWQLIWSLSPAISSWAYRDAVWVPPTFWWSFPRGAKSLRESTGSLSV